MKLNPTISIKHFRYYSRKQVFAISLYDLYNATRVPYMQEVINIHNPETNGVKVFVFSQADEVKYEYYNKESNLRIFVYRKGKKVKNKQWGNRTSLPWIGEKLYPRTNKPLVDTFCF